MIFLKKYVIILTVKTRIFVRILKKIFLVQKGFFRALFVILFFLLVNLVEAASVSIEGVGKIRDSRGYLFTINYQTTEEWTDGVVFKIYCRFNRGENIVFSSGGLSNIKRGWHKVSVNIPKVYRERYGPIIDYRIELYHRGILAALRGI